MRIPKWIWSLSGYAGILLICEGCTAVKPFRKVYLNDFSMKLGKMDIEKMDENMHAYREGASGGGAGKASGGCGCN